MYKTTNGVVRRIYKINKLSNKTAGQQLAAMLSKSIRHSRSLPMIEQMPCNQETMLHGIEPSLSVRPLQAAVS